MMVVLLNSITDVSPTDRGAVAISGSHGGVYPAGVASAAGLRAVVFNDAGIGFQQAGVGGVIALDQIGMAAAAVDCHSSLIGDAADADAHGIISFANKCAMDAGVQIGMSAREAAALLQHVAPPRQNWSAPDENQRIVDAARHKVHLLDSASMVSAAHEGEIVITGSHGALIGGDPVRALKADAAAAIFSDAGFGKNRIGASRLSALDHREIAAGTVYHSSARIGDAGSIYETGIVSAVNDTAFARGGRVGLSVKAFVMGMIAATA